MRVTNNELILKRLAQIPGYFERENPFTLENNTIIKTPNKIIFAIGNNGYVLSSFSRIDINNSINWVSGEQERASSDYRNGTDFYIYAERLDLVSFSYKLSADGSLDKRTYTKIARFHCASVKSAVERNISKGDILEETLKDKKDDLDYVNGKNREAHEGGNIREEMCADVFLGGEVVCFTNRNRVSPADCSMLGKNKVIGFAMTPQSPGKKIDIQTSGDIVSNKKLIPGERYFLGNKGSAVLRSELPENRFYEIEVGIARNATTLSITLETEKESKSFIFDEKKNGIIIPLFGDITKEKSKLVSDALREFKELPSIVVFDKETISREERNYLKDLLYTGAKLGIKISSQNNQKGVSAISKEIKNFRNLNLPIEVLFIEDAILEEKFLGYLKEIRSSALSMEISTVILSSKNKVEDSILRTKPSDIIMREFTATPTLDFPDIETTPNGDFRTNALAIKSASRVNPTLMEKLLKYYGWIYIHDSYSFDTISPYINDIARMIGYKTYASPSLHHSLIGSHFIHNESGLSKEVFGVLQDGSEPIKKSEFKQLYSMIGDFYNSINEDYGFISVNDWCLIRGYKEGDYFYGSPPPYYFENSANPTINVETLDFNNSIIVSKKHGIRVNNMRARFKGKSLPSGYKGQVFKIKIVDENTLEITEKAFTLLSEGENLSIVFEGGIGYTKAKQTFIDGESQKINRFESEWITLNGSLSNFSYIAHHFMGEKLENLIIDVIFKKGNKTYKIEGSDYKESGAPTYSSSGYYLSSVDLNRFSINFLESISLPSGEVIMDFETSGEFKFIVYKPEIFKTFTKNAIFDIHVNSNEDVEVIIPSPESFNNVLRYTKVGKGSGKVNFRIKKEFVEKKIGKDVGNFYVIDDSESYTLNSEGSFIEFIPFGEYGSRIFRIGKYSDYITLKDSKGDVIRRNVTIKKKEGGFASAMFELDIANKANSEYFVGLPIKSANNKFIVQLTKTSLSGKAEEVAVIDKKEDRFTLLSSNYGNKPRSTFDVRIDNIILK